MHQQNAMEKDINNIFEDIFLCEEKITSSAYEEGVQKGKLEGNIEGYHLGYHRGAEIGAELGFYLGVCQKYLSEKRDTKICTHLEKLENLIENFPVTNDKDVDILGKMDEIRANYKKLCSLLKIDGKFPENDKLSF